VGGEFKEIKYVGVGGMAVPSSISLFLHYIIHNFPSLPYPYVE